MISTYTSKTSRIDGQTNGLKGRPRKISIVKDNQLRRDIAQHTPWNAFFTHPVAWALYVNSWTLGWIGLMLLSYMPSFLVEVLGFDLQNASILCVFPYVALFICSNIFGVTFEYLQVHHGWSTDSVRLVAQDVGMIGSVVGLIICGFMDQKYVAYAFMIVTQCLIGATDSGISCSYSDVAPNYSSSFNTVGNIIASAAGIVGPLVISALLDSEPGVWGWRIAFFISGAQVVVSVVLWHMYQTSKPIDALNNPATAAVTNTANSN
jgi:MFS family permease